MSSADAATTFHLRLPGTLSVSIRLFGRAEIDLHLPPRLRAVIDAIVAALPDRGARQ